MKPQTSLIDSTGRDVTGCLPLKMNSWKKLSVLCLYLLWKNSLNHFYKIISTSTILLKMLSKMSQNYRILSDTFSQSSCSLTFLRHCYWWLSHFFLESVLLWVADILPFLIFQVTQFPSLYQSFTFSKKLPFLPFSSLSMFLFLEEFFFLLGFCPNPLNSWIQNLVWGFKVNVLNFQVSLEYLYVDVPLHLCSLCNFYIWSPSPFSRAWDLGVLYSWCHQCLFFFYNSMTII